jgi:GNAT superfamily N-acetyltransferase
MSAPEAAAYTVRELTDADEPAVLELLAASLAGGPTGERTPEFLRWKHRDNPFGRSPGLVAHDPDGALAAVRLLLRWELLLGDRLVRAVRAVDTATHPAHQGRGLFRQLTTTALATVAADADLVFNTPNSQSLPGYLKMGWQVVGVVPISLRARRPLRVLRHYRGAGQAPVVGAEAPVQSVLPYAADVLPEHLDGVETLLSAVARASSDHHLRTRTSVDYLRWRFADPPGLDYRAIPVLDGSRLRGLGLGRLRRRGQLSELTLGEVLVQPGDTEAARAVLRGAARSGADMVTCHLSPGSTAAAAARLAGYVTVPGRGLTMTVHTLRGAAPQAAQPSSWRLQLGDLELF